MQSPQSSATVALRALVMLAFTIAIPLAAFNGSSLPDRARKLLEKFWPAVTSAISTTTSSVLPEAPPYGAKSPNPLSPPSQPMGGISNPPASNVVPASYQVPVEPRLESPGTISNGQAGKNPFLSMQDRLRQLGATYYLLETWGNQRQVYRFYCQMAVGGSTNYTRYFEATNSDPMEAMSDVLRQVETWRGGGNAVR
jgi:hypothetical protein